MGLMDEFCFPYCWPEAVAEQLSSLTCLLMLETAKGFDT